MTVIPTLPGISLEILEERHAPELFALTNANRAYLKQWLPWLDGTNTIEDTRAFIAATRRQKDGNNGFQTAIAREGALVGVIGHHGVNWQNKSCSLGYWLAETAQGIARDVEWLYDRYVSHVIYSLLSVERSAATSTEPRR